MVAPASARVNNNPTPACWPFNEGQFGPSNTANVARIPHFSVTVPGRGSPTMYESVLLIDILKGAGVPTGDELRGAELRRYIV